MQTTIDNSLYLPLLAPWQRHPIVIASFNDLSGGESLTVHNDHDPKPLYFQLLAERGNVFTWQYQEQGPERWIVKITKRITGEIDETLGQIAIKDLRKIAVLRRYGLDFCCGGKKTVKEACVEKGLDSIQVQQDLLQVDKMPSSRPLGFVDWNLDFLIDYIVNIHHRYIRKTLPDLTAVAEKVMKVHCNQHPELKGINHLISEINAEITDHLVKEENILFPYIKTLIPAKDHSPLLPAAHFRSVQSPINMMVMEHELVGKNLAEIRQLSHSYLLPKDACASYSLLYQMLGEFEEDLHLHIHIENNILFPKALEAETLLNN